MKASGKGASFWILVVAAAFIVAQAAIAAIPSSDGTIFGCYRNRDGELRVIDKEAGKQCKTKETELSWNQEGPPGVPGPVGAPGLSKGFTFNGGSETVIPSGVVVARLPLPPGNYVVTAAVSIRNTDPIEPAFVSCDVQFPDAQGPGRFASLGNRLIGPIEPGPSVTGGRSDTVAWTGFAVLTQQSAAEIHCSLGSIDGIDGGPTFATEAQISAIPVDELTFCRGTACGTAP